jgi:polysaccharide export outer membrane protein
MAIRVVLTTTFLRILTGIILVAVSVDASAQLSDVDDGLYLIQPGDLLEVSVWREDYLERDVTVQPDGRISFPLVGVVDAAGSTVEQVQDRVASRLAQYIADPVVTVSIKEIRGNRIYILGQVQNPGQFIMNPRIDVMQALALAGGTTPFAELNDIRILRRSGNRQTLIEFRYGDIARGRNLQQNIVLQSGDVIIVP